MQVPAAQPPTGARLHDGVVASANGLSHLAARTDAQLPRLAPTSGNSLKLLVDEHAVLPAMLDSVRSARKQIDLAMFSLSDTGAGKQLIDAMVERAQAGVRVHVTLDQVGSAVAPFLPGERMVDRLRTAGIDVAVNKRISSDGLQAVDHRKLLVVDGETAFTGGMNFSGKFGKWHDLMVQVQGPAVAQLSAHFVDRWVDLTGAASDAQRGALATTAPRARLAGLEQARGGATLLVNKPRGELHASEDLLQNLGRAKERAWILTPTLSDPEVVDALCAAARRGVDTRVAVSGPEGWIGTRALRLVGATFYGDLVAAGVQVFEQPGMSHAKLSLVDDVATTGSLNMTRRAMIWDHELMLSSDQPSFVRQVHDLFTTDFAKSTLITPERASSAAYRFGSALRRATGLRW